MPIPLSLEAWQVSSRQDFACYLRLLAYDCEQVCQERDPGFPVATRWTNRTVDGFLWAWVLLLRGQAADAGPGWRGLACQLDVLRTAPGETNLAVADPQLDSEDVAGAADLRAYAAALAVDFARDRREMRAKAERGEWVGDGGSWAHRTLHGWLAGWASWVAADSPLHAELEPVTWRSVALQLSAAKIYE
ncbi:hypothetical protein [Kitasatospora azatica]|uniref:hypothetical protein n=1 Tax=Kitasatospora azatica TaxID=58347 RepID=UPI000566EAA5|nr:hypothetical protein [Kitasatospora azatica]